MLTRSTVKYVFGKVLKDEMFGIPIFDLKNVHGSGLASLISGEPGQCKRGTRKRFDSNEPSKDDNFMVHSWALRWPFQWPFCSILFLRKIPLASRHVRPPGTIPSHAEA